MQRLSSYIFLVLVISLFSCYSNKKLIDKYKTKYGSIIFYSENVKKGNPDVKRIYASVDSSGNRSYYSFYPEGILKRTDTAKELAYIVFYDQLPKNYDTNLYQKFSSLDSFVLTQGDKLLDSLELTNFKRSKGAEAYIIEVSYYHGYPKKRKFRP